MLGEKNAVRYADEIIVLSRGVQQYFSDTYGRKTVYIPNGVNRPEILPAKLIKEKYGLEKDSYLLFLGRLVPEKGIQYLIKAFKQVDTDKKLVIAGGSSDSDGFMQEITRLAADDHRILFTGFVQGQMLAELYSNAYIYCLPSDLEGMPLSLLEAMSYGNCCLTSDIAECAEVVEDKAAVFEKGNIAALQRNLKELCQHPERVKQYKKEAADFICEKYNWDMVVQQTLDIYSGEKVDEGTIRSDRQPIKKVLQTQDVLEKYTKNCSQVKYETTESYYIKLMKIYRGEKNVEQISS